MELASVEFQVFHKNLASLMADPLEQVEPQARFNITMGVHSVGLELGVDRFSPLPIF
jgi:hypothetical protein